MEIKLSETTDLINKEMDKMSNDDISFNAKLICTATEYVELVKNDNRHDPRYNSKYFVLMVLNQISNLGW